MCSVLTRMLLKFFSPKKIGERFWYFRVALGSSCETKARSISALAGWIYIHFLRGKLILPTNQRPTYGLHELIDEWLPFNGILGTDRRGWAVFGWQEFFFGPMACARIFLFLSATLCMIFFFWRSEESFEGGSSQLYSHHHPFTGL